MEPRGSASLGHSAATDAAKKFQDAWNTSKKPLPQKDLGAGISESAILG